MKSKQEIVSTIIGYFLNSNLYSIGTFGLFIGTVMNSKSLPNHETWNLEKILIMNIRRVVSAMDFAIQILDPTPKGDEARLRGGTDPSSHLKN